MTSPPRSNRSQSADPVARGALGNVDVLGALLAQVAAPGNPIGDVGFHQGTVLAWDSVTGTNAIQVLGAVIEDVPVLTTGDNVLLSVGNLVGVLRFKTSYFVLGRITAPGGGNAFAWTYEEEGTSGVVNAVFPNWGDLTPNTGPTVRFEVGTSRRALVFMSFGADVGTLSTLNVGLEVVGVNSYGPNWEAIITNNSATDNFFFPTTQFVMLTENPGSGNLDPGSTTITLKYQLLTAGDSADVSFRRLLVIPF